MGQSFKEDAPPSQRLPYIKEDLLGSTAPNSPHPLHPTNQGGDRYRGRGMHTGPPCIKGHGGPSRGRSPIQSRGELCRTSPVDELEAAIYVATVKGAGAVTS